MYISATCPKPKITTMYSLAPAAAALNHPPPFPVYNFGLHLTCYIDCGLLGCNTCKLVGVCQHFLGTYCLFV